MSRAPARLPGRSQQSPPASPRPPRLEALAVKIASQDYPGYTQILRRPPISLMIKAGLWIELEAAVGFILGLGLASLMGQRTVPVILLIVLQMILTPILSAADIPHLQDLQRSFVGLAVAHLEPSGLPMAFGLPGVAGGVGAPGRRAITAARVGHRGRLRHHRLAGGLDDPRRMANDDQGRLRNAVLTGSARLVVRCGSPGWVTAPPPNWSASRPWRGCLNGRGPAWAASSRDWLHARALDRVVRCRRSMSRALGGRS